MLLLGGSQKHHENGDGISPTSLKGCFWLHGCHQLPGCFRLHGCLKLPLNTNLMMVRNLQGDLRASFLRVSLQTSVQVKMVELLSSQHILYN